jgi:predicted O-methyltransferase YrrM
MHDLLETIIRTRQVLDHTGAPKPLHGETQREQCLLLQSLIEELKPTRSLEVGLAYGISTMAICEKLPAGAKHIVCDPYQNDWNNIGLLNVERAGFSPLVDFRREMAHRVLADLERDGTTLDFAYLDGGKMFDLVMVNVFYLTKILRVGGLLVMDDCDFPGIRRVCQFLATLPCYQIAATWGGHAGKTTTPLLGKIIRTLPGSGEILKSDVADSSSKLADRPHCIVYKKIAADDRKWDWHAEF